ncbi:DNA polymerase I [Criibacterium bergeronii]|uniref:DNA polymerase I n=1 Tax=Criibacterium bergeronii TaxID=1871336 RepID=A0A371IJX9_9FIRM|nr:DNA polymerase I [Criibacterium bergeronii]RDY20797.1 DNA polymerase I [Criibacterium bergeronii]TRW26073.1 DNA polymerase I [Criibacterium bergeronii]
MENLVIIIDGNSLMNRAFYALPEMTDKKGRHTNALYGFANIIFKILKEYTPTHFAVAFDLKAPTFRHKMYDGYKAGRKKMPDELAEQIEPLKQMIDFFGINRLELEGFEADDILGVVAKKAGESGLKTYIITGDKDSFQLATDNVSILFTKKGISEIEVVDKQKMLDDYGITPTEFIDLKALMGDSSDNIPGVAGIGEKTGLKLIQEYKSIENIYKHIDEIKGAVQKKLIADEESAYMSKKLATIHSDLPVDFETEEILYNGLDTKNLTEFFQQRDMVSLVKRLSSTSNEVVSENGSVSNEKIKEIEYTTDPQKLLAENSKRIFIKVVKEDAPVNIRAILSLCIMTEKNSYCIDEKDIEKIKPILISDEVQKCGFDIKEDYIALLAYDIEMKNVYFDSKIAQYLFDPDASSYDISNLSASYSLPEIDSAEAFFGKGKNKKVITSFNKKEIEPYYLQMMYIVKGAIEKQTEKIKAWDMSSLFFDVEMPLVTVLGDMQYAGVAIDKAALLDAKKEFSSVIMQLEKDIYQLANQEFNINSPKQLGKVLFEDLGLPTGKKTKTGYSTDAKVLENLIDAHPIVEKILSYRTYTKLLSTYVDGLLAIINKDTGRIHSSFNQTITATGRISSTEPNLQNIPVRDAIGRNLRKAFIAKDGDILVDADYSQIELRVLADISNETVLIDGFNEGIDIHTRTASEVFEVPIDEVTKELRSAAKAVNFGIVYGISDFGLSNNLGIGRKKAGEYIKNYLDRFKNIEKYMDDIVKQAEKDGYVTTFLNRRRYIPQINMKNFIQKNLGKRLAMNTPVQGSAADIIKIAMVKVSKRLKKEKLKSKLILQIHDELIIEATMDEKEIVEKLLKEEMEHAYKLKSSLKADVQSGKSWYDTK